MIVESNCPCCQTKSVMKRAQRTKFERNVTMRKWHKFKCSSCSNMVLLSSNDYNNSCEIASIFKALDIVGGVKNLKLRSPLYLAESNQ